MSSSLRNQVEALKVSVQEEPTTPETLLSRGKLLWEWANSFSLTGIALPVECSFLRVWPSKFLRVSLCVQSLKIERELSLGVPSNV